MISVDVGLLAGLCTLSLGVLQVFLLVSRNHAKINLLDYRVGRLENQQREIIDRLHD